MTNDEIEAVRAALDDVTTLSIRPEDGEAIDRALATITHLLARAEQAERERDEALDELTVAQDRLCAEEARCDMLDQCYERYLDQLAARDAAIAESLRRADDVLVGPSYVTEPLRQFQQPEPDKLVEAVKALQDGRAGPTPESYAACLRNEVEARGGRVVFDGEVG